MADAEGIKIFTADIIYHLEERFREHMAVRALRLAAPCYVAFRHCMLQLLDLRWLRSLPHTHLFMFALGPTPA